MALPQVHRLAIFVTVQLMFWSTIWFAIQRVPIVRKQWLKFKRLTKSGPFYRVGRLLVRQFWSALSRFLWFVYGDKMDAKPSSLSIPKLSVTSKTKDSIEVSWTAKPSSFYSRDTYQLQTRRCASGGPTEWRDAPVPTEAAAAAPTTTGPSNPKKQRASSSASSAASSASSRTFALMGLEPGQCHEFRCRTVNRAGAGPWAPGHAPLRVYTRQAPEGGGGVGPGYHWRQSNSSVQAVLPLLRSRAPGREGGDDSVLRGADLTGLKPRQIQFTSSAHAVKIAASSSAAVVVDLMDGAWCHEVVADSVDWEFQEIEGMGCRCLVVSARKAKATKKPSEHWPQLLKGHPTIDKDELPQTLTEASLFDL